MKLSVQTGNLRLFREALKSSCSGVRLGSEFCEHLLPDPHTLEMAYELACEQGKEFTYVTPRLSNAGIEKLKEQFTLLSETGEVTDCPRPTVVVNDFGALNILQNTSGLHPHLGRNLFLVPARSPWAEGHIQWEEPSPETRWLRDLYSATSLNYQPTMELYRRHGCQKVDVDWIPSILPSLSLLVEEGFSLSVHLHLVPVTFTRKCHMARFLGEKSPETCSRPCLNSAFLLKNEAVGEYEEDFGLQLYLGGNTVFRVIQPSPADIRNLHETGVAELVLTMNPITRIDSARAIDDFILAHTDTVLSGK
jgi:hypothetical protein